ncbi:MAG: amylo-alpha-1,6-glucosidase [Actinomycetes bacterium]
MPVGWTFAGEPSSLGSPHGTVTLVEGAAFCVGGLTGDIAPELPGGLFFRDTRVLSRWQLLVDDQPPEALATVPAEPFATTFVGRAMPRAGRADSTLLVLRHRYVGNGMREDLVLRNLSGQPAACTLTLTVDADFADLFEVKESRVRVRGEHVVHAGADGLCFERRTREDVRGTRVHGEGWAASADRTLTVDVVVPARGEWSSTLQVHPSLDGVETPSRYPSGQPVERTLPSTRLRAWRHANPVVHTEHQGLAQLLRRTEEDLGALRIFDPRHRNRVAVAAGAPWFMTVFGRDSLLTAWMALLLDQSLALGTLNTLAEFQGTTVDPLSEQEPGRILHEMRFGMDSARSLAGGSVYYGSIDATPLFVMLLGELHRWGADPAALAGLLPAADRALDWIEQYGDRDGDGFVEYERATDHGLQNQGWKDSFDGVTSADGRVARTPIALAEVQGYVYAAYLARAHIAVETGDTATARRLTDKAVALRKAFNDAFWLPEGGWFALALDGDKRPVDSLASNMGHCLWTGIIDEDKAAAVADHLLSPEMFTGWGVRTLASSMAAYNPMSYHNGSVWPHDNAIVAAGLMRYGFVEHAQRVAAGVIEAATSFGGRLPELFCGFDRSEFAAPIPYPTSCSPQAWAAASPLLLLRTLLRFDPSVPQGRLWLAPELPAALGDLRIERVPLAGARLAVDVTDGRVETSGLPAGVRVVREGRPAVRDVSGSALL